MASGPPPAVTEAEIELEAASARAFRRRLAWAFGGLIFVILVAFGYVYFVDGPPPDDTDLMVRDPQVPDEQNGKVQLRKWQNPPDFIKFATAHGVNQSTASKILRGTQKNDALVDEFLAQTQPAFAQLDAILALPHFAVNEQFGPGFQFPALGPIIDLGRALALAAQRNLDAGNYDEAVRNVLRLRKLSVRCAEGQAFLNQVLVAESLQKMAAVMAARLLNDPALPPSARDALAAGWQPFSWPEALRRGLPLEYQYGTFMLGEFKHTGWPYGGPRLNDKLLAEWSNLSLQPNNTRRMLAELYRAEMKAYTGPYAAINFAAIGQSWSTGLPKSGVKYYVAANYGGRQTVGEIAGTVQFVDSAYAASANSEMVRAALAVRHYYDDNHALPAKLDDLGPRYLPEVPADPFDGKPLRYDAKRGLIYSIGTSLTDNGGSTKYIDPKKPDESYQDRLSDHSQPTLDLLFQNPPAPDARNTAAP